MREMMKKGESNLETEWSRHTWKKCNEKVGKNGTMIKMWKKMHLIGIAAKKKQDSRGGI
jgi:hypothetical protein